MQLLLHLRQITIGQNIRQIGNQQRAIKHVKRTAEKVLSK